MKLEGQTIQAHLQSDSEKCNTVDSVYGKYVVSGISILNFHDSFDQHFEAGVLRMNEI